MLVASALTKRFGNITALDNVSFRILPNESLGVVGHNGSGKSTLRLAIMRQINLDTGELAFDGVNLIHQAPHHLKALGIASVGQFTNLVESLTIFENVAMGYYGVEGWKPRFGPPSRSRVERVLKLVKMESDVDSPVARLTLYERRLVELARALIASPRLLILDEPTTGLTALERREIIEVLRGVQRSVRSLLIIDHALSAIDQLCDRAIVMETGRVIGCHARTLVNSGEL